MMIGDNTCDPHLSHFVNLKWVVGGEVINRFLFQCVTNVITMCDRYYKVRRLLQRATEQCSGSKDGKPAFHPYRYHLGLVKPQRLASLQKQKFALCKVRGRLATSWPLISSYRKWAKWVSMHEVAQRPSELRSLEVDLFRLNGSEC